MEKSYFDTLGIKGKVQIAVARDTAKALQIFCEQEPEFVQAIEQSGHSFQDCLDSIAKNCNRSCVSDFEVYSQAVAFYFPGAKVRFEMQIDLIGDADSSGSAAKTQQKKLSVDLGDLLDF